MLSTQQCIPQVTCISVAFAKYKHAQRISKVFLSIHSINIYFLLGVEILTLKEMGLSVNGWSLPSWIIQTNRSDIWFNYLQSLFVNWPLWKILWKVQCEQTRVSNENLSENNLHQEGQGKLLWRSEAKWKKTKYDMI